MGEEFECVLPKSPVPCPLATMNGVPSLFMARATPNSSCLRTNGLSERHADLNFGLRIRVQNGVLPTSFLPRIPRLSYMMEDGGANVTMVPCPGQLQNLTYLPRPVAVDGMAVHIVAYGSLTLHFVTREGTTVPVTITACLAPEMLSRTAFDIILSRSALARELNASFYYPAPDAYLKTLAVMTTPSHEFPILQHAGLT